MEELIEELALIREREETQAYKLRDLQKRRMNWAIRVEQEDVVKNDGIAYSQTTHPKLIALEQAVLKEFEFTNVYTRMLESSDNDGKEALRKIYRIKKSLDRADVALEKYEHDMNLNERVMGIHNFDKEGEN